MPDIFDELEASPSQDIFDEISVSEQPSRARSLASAYPKGLLKGASEFVSQFNLFPGAIPHELGSRVLDQILQTQEELPEQLLERAGKLTPAAITGAEGVLPTIARTGAATLLGQTAQELGGSETVQNLAELSAFLAPKFSGKLMSKKGQKEAVDFLRSKGLSDKEITPLIQSEKKIRFLKGLAEKGDKTKSRLQAIGEKLGQGYEELKLSAEKFPALTGEKQKNFINNFEDTLEKINPRFRRLLRPDLEDLFNKDLNFKSLVDFYQDINQVVKGQEGGKAVLNILKKPILQGLEDISPELTKDFSKLNEFYAKKSQIGKALKPKESQELFKAIKVLGTIGSLFSGNPAAIKAALGYAGVSKLARELLINPKLQNFSQKMIDAAEKNKIMSAYKLFKSFKDELKSSNKDVFDEIEFED